MDREQVIDLVREASGFAGLPDEEEAVAEAVVAELERRDLLALGPKRRWKVTVDDPNAAQRHVYDDIEAHSAHAASVKAARRVIVDDPRATITTPHPLTARAAAAHG